MNRRVLFALALVLAASLLGQACLLGPEAGPERDALARNRARWEGQGIRTYEVEYVPLCFCLNEPVRLHVREGVIHSAVRVADGSPVEPGRYGEYRTVDQAFATIEAAIRDRAHEVRVDYDPTYGHPVHVYIDHDSRAADEETIFDLRGLRPLR